MSRWSGGRWATQRWNPAKLLMFSRAIARKEFPGNGEVSGASCRHQASDNSASEQERQEGGGVVSPSSLSVRLDKERDNLGAATTPAHPSSPKTREMDFMSLFNDPEQDERTERSGKMNS